MSRFFPGPVLPVLFDKALHIAKTFAEQHASELGQRPIVVRDLFGRPRIALDDRVAVLSADLDRLAAELHAQLGAYSPGQLAGEMFLRARELFAPERIFDSAELQPLSEHVRLLERQITGDDWLLPPLDPEPAIPRATRISRNSPRRWMTG